MPHTLGPKDDKYNDIVDILVHFRNIKKYLFFRDWTWYFLLNGTKRFIGQVDMDGVIKQLEEEAAEACGAYDAVVEIRDRLNEEISEMNSSKKTMMAEIEESQGDLSSYQRDLATAADLKSQKEQELAATQKKLADTEGERQGIDGRMGGSLGRAREDPWVGTRSRAIDGRKGDPS